MRNTLLIATLAPSLLFAQNSAAAPWNVELTGADRLAAGDCRQIAVDLRDASGKERPRGPNGQLVLQADFDMAVTPTGVAVGRYDGPSNWSVCACQGAPAATALTVTATYPAAQLAEKLRVPGVAFTTSKPVTITGPGPSSANPIGCQSRSTTTSASTAAMQTVSAPISAVQSATSATALVGTQKALLPPGDGTLYVTVTSNRQGKLMTESPRGFGATAMTYEVKIPYEASTGLSTGRRQYSPLIITKDWSAASPQLHSALASNDQLTVQIDRYRSGPSGEQIVESITLKQARLSGIRHFSDGAREMEALSFSFAQFEFKNAPAGTAVTDAMSTPQ